MASHFHPLKIRDVRRETAECVSISFEIPDELESAFKFVQGQNITVRTMNGAEEIRRSYSICSSPLDKELRIAVKEVPNGIFSSYANQRLQPGDILEVMPPSGKFYVDIDPGSQANYLGIAAGSGITPLLSIIATTLALQKNSHFTLLYGNRSRSSIIFREQLQALKNRYIDRFSIIYVFSREQVESPTNQGRLDVDKCREFDNKLVQFNAMDHVFLCGPLPMIESITSWLKESGIPGDRIHFELFNAPLVVKNQELNRDHRGLNQQTDVTLTLDGTTRKFSMDWYGESVLDAALATGAELPFACKGGVCATCKARLLEGEVEMVSNYALEHDELKAGFILTCQSHPRSAAIRVDFDAK
ncbi:MAG TPA: 1,2-phenylacetyl-CoA epoxidase subunit PaaE [Flavitalea sp.]|nr:1,2-phenylacetyl-CoA epoxidase subunit PaaE [Flavitalea sp.]